ncbi:MAG TPA: geranylgeranyl reductase family protein [Gaiellaceae bacterium]|nr:geranylgeranyl reductase family protein [Gaiellaceae bacterium]
MPYDAIIAGAGPAGSACAYRLAAAGASVLLLDRATFPRDKPCGGGLTLRALDVVPVPIDAVVEDVVDVAELRLNYGTSVERGSGKPLAVMTQRIRLDALLVAEAVRAGAELRDGTKVQAVEAGDAGVVVTAGGERFAGRTLVGADGVNGVVGRALGLGGNQAVGVALEGNVPWTKLDRSRYGGRIVMELAVLPGGYGWVFPKGDHANVGVGGWEREGPHLRSHLVRVCREHGIGLEDVEGLRGYRLPLRSPRSAVARGRALLVGDAAGLVDPLSGDGMYEAFVSARLAAESVLDLLGGRAATLEDYGARLGRSLSAHLWASWGVKVALDRFPRTTFALATTGLVWGAIEKVVRGELPDVTAARGIARAPLKALAMLGRAAGNPGHAFREA